VAIDQIEAIMTEMSIRGRIEVEKDAEALAQHVAEWFVDFVARRPGMVRLSLAGGSTPRELYRILCSSAFRDRIPWERLEFYWGDERFVPPDDAASNYRMVKEALLSNVPVPPGHIHPIPTDVSPEDAARRYEALLRTNYGADRFDPGRPLFDLMLLGLGSDGHTGSLLPGQPVLAEREHWVAAVVAGRAEPRITLTYPAIESSHTIAFLAVGAEKAAAVEAVRAGDTNLPAARIAPHGDVIWFLDRDAAGESVQ
jgi:6-phosphogluconolactonase